MKDSVDTRGAVFARNDRYTKARHFGVFAGGFQSRLEEVESGSPEQ
jgi:hypothetical protein